MQEIENQSLTVGPGSMVPLAPHKIRVFVIKATKLSHHCKQVYLKISLVQSHLSHNLDLLEYTWCCKCLVIFCLLFNVCILSRVCHELFWWICCCALVCGMRVMALFGLCMLKSCNISEAAWVIDSPVVIDSQVGMGVWGFRGKQGRHSSFVVTRFIGNSLKSLLLLCVFYHSSTWSMKCKTCTIADVLLTCSHLVGPEHIFFLSFCVRFLAPFGGILVDLMFNRVSQ